MSVEEVLVSTINKARQHAMATEYKKALTYYRGLDEELAEHVGALIEQGDAARATEWETLRDVIARERQTTQAVVDELAAFANPAAAVRLDRNNGSGPPSGVSGGGGGGGANPYKVPRGREAAGNGGGPRAPYRTDNEDDDYQGGGPAYNLAAHDEPPRPRYREDRPVRQPAARRAPAEQPHSGDINERLYGDRDRFAPDPGAGAGPTMGFGVPPAIPKRNAGGGGNAAAGTPQARRAAAGGGSGGNGGASGGKDRRKPALPKFGAGGGAGGAGAAGKKAAGGGGGGGGGEKNVGEGAKKRPPYVPRAGDEEHAEAIASEMTDPATIGVDFEDIAGQEEAKEALQEAVIFPALMPDYYSGVIRPAKGVMLYGPPGTGKSMLAKAVASQGKTTFFNVSPATLVSKMRGDSEKLIRVLFEMARHYSPSVIFIDEIDSLCGQRGSDQHEASRRTLSVLLSQMDGVGVDASQYVMVLGATNHPWDIDEAMRRRLEKRIYIPLPKHKERVTLLNLLVSKQNSVKIADDVDFEAFSGEIERLQYSGADLSLLAREAFQMPMRRYVAENRADFMKNPQAAQEAIKAIPVTIHDFRAAVQKTPSSVDAGLLSKFVEWKSQFE